MRRVENSFVLLADIRCLALKKLLAVSEYVFSAFKAQSMIRIPGLRWGIFFAHGMKNDVLLSASLIMVVRFG